MTTEHFAYWLQGFFELTNSNTLTEEQVKIIKDHLQLVFHKATPTYNQGQYESYGSSGTDLNEKYKYMGTPGFTCSVDPRTYIGDHTHFPYQPETFGSGINQISTNVDSGTVTSRTIIRGFLNSRKI